MRSFSPVAMIVLLVLIILPALPHLDISKEADALGELRVTIEMDSYEPNVDVDPQRGGIITYTGSIRTVQVNDPDFQLANVFLEANCSAGWRVTEIPVLTLTRGTSVRQFSVSVFVPQLYKASEIDTIHTLTIKGNWAYDPGILTGDIDPTNVFLHVNQVYQYTIKCNPGYIHTSPGGEFIIDLEITNEGNGDDEVEISIDRRDRMEDNGWAFVFSQTQFILPYDETIIVPVRVTTPSRWDGWRNVISVIRFQVTSSQALQNSDVAENVYYSVYVRQRGVSVPGFEAPLLLVSVMAVAFLMVRRRR